MYVEVFGGGGAVLMAKKISTLEVFNDIDSGLCNFFMVLSDPDDFEKFHRMVDALPFSKQMYREFLDEWGKEKDKIKRAVKWFYVARNSFSGIFGNSWGFSVNTITRGMLKSVSDWRSIVDLLPEIHNRLIRVQIENRDWSHIFNIYDSENTLFYLDPPYVKDARTGSGKYVYEMTNDQQEILTDRLLKIKGKAVLSGYKNKIYEKLEKSGWIRKDYKVTCCAIGRTKNLVESGYDFMKSGQRVESLWIKPFDVKSVGLFSG